MLATWLPGSESSGVEIPRPAEAKHVWEGSVQDGVPWSVVDMSAFEVVVPPTPDEKGYQEAWDRAVEKGKAYWAPGDAVQVAEVLVPGPVLLTRRLELIQLLREVGLVEPNRVSES